MYKHTIKSNQVATNLWLHGHKGLFLDEKCNTLVNMEGYGI